VGGFRPSGVVVGLDQVTGRDHVIEVHLGTRDGGPDPVAVLHQLLYSPVTLGRDLVLAQRQDAGKVLGGLCVLELVNKHAVSTLPDGRALVGGSAGLNVWGAARGHAEQQLPPRHQDHVTLVRLARPAGAAEYVELDGRIGQVQVERGQAVRPNVFDYRVDAAVRV